MIKFYTKNPSMGWHVHDTNIGMWLQSPTKVFQFPGGEMHVTDATSTNEVPVLIGHDPKDLIALRLWADFRKRNNLSRNVVIPYLPAARQDRGAPLSAGSLLSSLRESSTVRLTSIQWELCLTF